MSKRASMRIEEATPDDVSLILSFVRELAQYEKSEERVKVNEKSLRANLFGARPYAHALIVYHENRPIAFAIYFFSYSSFAGQPSLYLEDIFVRPAFRDLGVGKELFAFLSRLALEHNCLRMEWAVLNWNEPAIKFYEKLGATPVRDWTVFHLAKEEMERLAKVG